MRKTIFSPAVNERVAAGGSWIDLERHAWVEISSEDAQFPIEHALGTAVTTGWKAAATGPQVIRLHFDAPREIRRIYLHFVERASERKQEFAVVVEEAGKGRREVLRQQWTFSPGGATEEIEDFSVDLHGVTLIEVAIDPDRSHDPKLSQSFATLAGLRVA